MPLGNQLYQLTPNIYDGKQRSWDPDGVYQEDPGLPILQAPYGLGASNITTNGATITWSLDETQNTGQDFEHWIVGTSSAWIRTSLAPTARSHTLTGISSDTDVNVRIRAIYEDQN